ncbi:MAG: hypothetical protein HUJ54_02525, partial [Erysipelotrichaceae bacterium]|nr:hypothetical protein [Erysipelotrichaceae bacterium]
MIRRIFRSIFFVSLLSMLLAAAAMAFMFYQTYTDKLMDTLRTQTTVIGNMVNDTGVTYLRQLDDDAYRLNLIDENGNVLYDSLQDPETMTNHSSRPEIMDAREKGWGTSVRFSRTLDEQTLYTAMKLDNGSFIRTSVTVTSFYGCMIQLVIPFALMIACISGLCFFLSRRLSHEIVQPVLDINLDAPMKSETYPQILPLLERIEAGNREISRQMEALKQKSEELEAVARNMDEGLLILAADCSILSCNEAAQKIFGIEKNGGWQIKDSSLLAEAVNTAAGTGRSVFEMESGRRRYVIETACIHH